MQVSVNRDIQTKLLGCKMGEKMLNQWISVINKSTNSNRDNNVKRWHLKIWITETENFYSHLKPDNSQGQQIHCIIKVDGADIPAPHLLALSGHLGTFGQNPQKPFAPQYLVDMVITTSICLLAFAMINHFRMQKVQKSNIFIKNLSIIDCIKYFGAFNVSSVKNNLLNREKMRGSNILDGGSPFYQIYTCKNNSKLTIGNLQAKFYEQMINELDITKEQKQFCLENHMNFDQWAKIRTILEEKLREKTAEQWQNIMEKRDTCVIAVRPVQIQEKSYLHPIYNNFPKL